MKSMRLWLFLFLVLIVLLAVPVVSQQDTRLTLLYTEFINSTVPNEKVKIMLDILNIRYDSGEEVSSRALFLIIQEQNKIILEQNIKIKELDYRLAYLENQTKYIKYQNYSLNRSVYFE